MKKVGVAILGLGVVGGGTYRILTEHREMYKKCHKIDIAVEAVLERNSENGQDHDTQSGVYHPSMYAGAFKSANKRV